MTYEPGQKVVILEGSFAGSVAVIQEVDDKMLRVITTGRGNYEKWVMVWEVGPEGASAKETS